MYGNILIELAKEKNLLVAKLQAEQLNNNIAALSPESQNSQFAKIVQDSDVTTPIEFDDILNSKTKLQSEKLSYFNIKEESSVPGIVESMLACYLPPELGLQFPSMLDTSKQEDIVAPNILFRRVKDVDNLRFDQTIELLKERRHVAWIGHPGIGKSTEASCLLMEFIRRLGEPEWPAVVAHRVNKKLYIYSKNGNGQIECSSQPCKTKNDVFDYCHSNFDHVAIPSVVLFLELGENENDPDVGKVPTFIAISSRETEATLKTMWKSKRLAFFVVRPHSISEMRMMTRVMFHFDTMKLLKAFGLLSADRIDVPLKSIKGNAQLCEVLPEYTHILPDVESGLIGEEVVVRILDWRVQQVGPLIRDVLRSPDGFHYYIAHGVLPNIQQFFDNQDGVKKLGIDTIPKACKYFVAPYPTLKMSDLDFEFKFLSDRLMHRIAECKKLPDYIEIFRNFGFNYQIVESTLRGCLMKYALFGDAMPKWATDGWEWHSDPGFNNSITKKTKISNSDIPLHEKCDQEVSFSGMTFKEDAKDLKPNTLYRSTTLNFKLGEFFTYENREGKRSVNYYQCTTKSLPNHPVTINTLESVFKGLQLFEVQNKDVVVNVIYFVDGGEISVRGSKFTIKSSDGKTNEEVAPAQLRKHKVLNKYAHRIKTYIVRSRIYDIRNYSCDEQDIQCKAYPDLK